MFKRDLGLSPSSRQYGNIPHPDASDAHPSPGQAAPQPGPSGYNVTGARMPVRSRESSPLFSSIAQENAPACLTRALRACTELFPETTLQGTQRAYEKMRASREYARSYVWQHQFGRSVPERVREILAVLDAGDDDIRHIGIPRGRGNVFVRNADALANKVPGNDNSFVHTELSAKNYLTRMYHEIYSKMSSTEADLLEDTMVSAAAALVTGSSTCCGYADLQVAVGLHRLSRLDLSEDESVEFRLVSSPVVKGKIIDHVYAEATYTCQDGSRQPQEYTIILDLWAGSRPVLKLHSAYTGGVFSAPLGLGNVPTKNRLGQYIRQAAGLVDSVRFDDSFRRGVAEFQFKLRLADPDRDYSLDESHFGFVDGRAVSATSDDVRPNFSRRRPSISSASTSDLLVASAIDPGRCTPEEAVHLMLDSVDNDSAFRQWMASRTAGESGDLFKALTMALEDGDAAFHKAILFGRCGVLQAVGEVLNREDRGGLTGAMWGEILFAKDRDGLPAVLGAIGTLYRSLGNAIFQEYGKLLNALPPAEKTALWNSMLSAQVRGVGALEYALANAGNTWGIDTLLDLLPEEGIDPRFPDLLLQARRACATQEACVDKLIYDIGKGTSELTPDELATIRTVIDDENLSGNRIKMLEHRMSYALDHWVAVYSHSDEASASILRDRQAAWPDRVQEMVVERLAQTGGDRDDETEYESDGSGGSAMEIDDRR